MKSIFGQAEGECYICAIKERYVYHSCLEEHHIFGGTANRKISERYGMKVKLCLHHHRGDADGNKEAVHFNREMDVMLKQIGQERYEETYTREAFRRDFGKSWL